MRRAIRIGGGVLLVAFLAYLAGPLWAGWQLRQAIRTRDVAAMQSRVDWPLLRANLKPRISSAINDSADTSGTIGSVLKRAFGSVVSNAAINTLVTPSNLSRILAGRAFMLDRRSSTETKVPQPVDDNAEDPDDPVPPKRVRWAFFESPTRFRVEATNPSLPNSRIVSILALQGLSWRLVDIDIIKQ